MANNSNKRIGKYEIIRELGNGSVGLVYKAKDPHLNRLVAIKLLKTLSLGSQEDENNMALKRFYHEAQLACMLKHPNIITIFDAGVTELGAPYIVMEYVEGKDLGDIIIANEVWNYSSGKYVSGGSGQALLNFLPEPQRISLNNKLLGQLSIDFSEVLFKIKKNQKH